MNSLLDLDDIQGNIVKAYGRFGFPVARFVFYQIHLGEAGRRFVSLLTPSITTSAPWRDRAKIPDVATNFAFTYQGLKILGVPSNTLHEFPDEFAMGMKARRDILGDDGPSEPRRWDSIWNSERAEEEQPVHFMVAINAKSKEALDDRYEQIGRLVDQVNQEAGQSEAIEQLTGHKDELDGNRPYQEASAIYRAGIPVPEEHFGYMDGISDPFFKGSGAHPANVVGGGKPTRADPRTLEGWAPLETGEFLLGHKDEAFEYPRAPGPPLFSRNGTYMVYRKLHQNVGSFNAFLDALAARVPPRLAPDARAAKEFLAAKFAGRWRNGAPLTTFPTEEEAKAYMADLDAAQQQAEREDATAADKSRFAGLMMKLNGFDYRDDVDGSRCPRGAHIRRSNPRSSLEFENSGAFDTPGALSNRRRILRRGLPYGEVKDPERDDGNHGIIIMILNADIARQFEFVQQQWINFGNDFQLANDRDPLVGNQSVDHEGRGAGRMTIEGDPKTGQPPFFCGKIPTLVETRGGDYFFIPSLTSLRMIGKGIIDPT